MRSNSLKDLVANNNRRIPYTAAQARYICNECQRLVGSVIDAKYTDVSPVLHVVVSPYGNTEKMEFINHFKEKGRFTTVWENEEKCMFDVIVIASTLPENDIYIYMDIVTYTAKNNIDFNPDILTCNMIKTSIGELKLSPLKENGKFVFYNDSIIINGKISKGDRISIYVDGYNIVSEKHFIKSEHPAEALLIVRGEEHKHTDEKKNITVEDYYNDISEFYKNRFYFSK